MLEGVNVVEVLLARDELGASATTYGLLEAFFGPGAVAGSWAAGRIATDAARVRLVLVGLAGTALNIGLAGLAPTVAVLPRAWREINRRRTGPKLVGQRDQ